MGKGKSNSHKFLEKVPLSPKQSLGEEIANAVTHGLGIGLSIAALVLLVVFASQQGDVWKIVGFSIYGAMMILLYVISTLYHSFQNPQIKRLFRILDHSSIFLLIAGTYTPITLIMRGAWGWSIFGTIWGLTIIGIFMKIFFLGKMKIISPIIYVAMSFIVILAIKPVLKHVPHDVIMWILIGGGSYILGITFYLWRKMPYHHTIWHLFVLGGSISHFFAMLQYVR
jgi:hemolysin III